MTTYHYIGLALAVLSGCCCAAFVFCIMVQAEERKRPLYQRKLPEPDYPADFSEAVWRAYGITGDIRGMLRLLQSEWKGGTGRRIEAALDYLEHSRYRDYETALYQYLSDGSNQCTAVVKEILEQEIRKQRGLPERKKAK